MHVICISRMLLRLIQVAIGETENVPATSDRNEECTNKGLCKNETYRNFRGILKSQACKCCLIHEELIEIVSRDIGNPSFL